MTPDEIEAERERFETWWYSRYGSTDVPPVAYFQRLGNGYLSESVEGKWLSWLSRAEIASAEQAELRERVRELANLVLNTAVVEAINMGVSSKRFWSAQEAFYLRLAEESGVWFDDQGNEVPLDKWRARMGGVG